MNLGLNSDHPIVRVSSAIVEKTGNNLPTYIPSTTDSIRYKSSNCPRRGDSESRTTTRYEFRNLGLNLNRVGSSTSR